jgi:hypothetical protein
MAQAEEQQLLQQEAHMDGPALEEVHAPVFRSFRRYALPALLLSAAGAAAALGKASGMTTFLKAGHASKLFLNNIGQNTNTGIQAKEVYSNSNDDNVYGSQTINNGPQTNVKNHDGFVNVGNGQLKPCEGSGNDGSGAGAVAVVCCMSPNGPVGCDHASSGSGSSGGSGGNGGKASSLKELLESKGLDAFEDRLSKMGVESTSDLQYLDKKAIKTLKGTLIQEKKLEKAVEETAKSE